MRYQYCQPDVFTYTELIRGLGKAGRIDEAYHFFHEMQREGCRPDTILMNNMINFLGKAGRLDDAIKLFQQCQN